MQCWGGGRWPGKDTGSDVQDVLTAYHEGFLTKYGEPPVIHGGKDGLIVKRLVAQYGRDTVLTRLAQFFESDDPFIQNSSRTIGAFQSVMNRLIVQAANPLVNKTRTDMSGLQRFAERRGAP